MEERGEPHVLVLPRHLAHTIQITGHAHSSSASGTCFAGRVSLGRSPSLHHLRRPALGVVRQFRRYYEIVRLPTVVHHGITALAFPARPALPSPQAGDHGTSRFSRLERSRTCTGSPTPRGPTTTRENAAADVAFRAKEQRRHPGPVDYEAQ